MCMVVHLMLHGCLMACYCVDLLPFRFSVGRPWSTLTEDDGMGGFSLDDVM